ncbi:MAG: hypothetical protein J7574_12520 [Flavobacterium sp.]|uniref:hypothetical protein n=1 Tax=Flavobacterium sp. TaxID=239 RepID=UPI001B158955|nr:hypothetical protein [Flavobacterium sp.]MBO9584976.1 hypothetical protein [Flavobacterium sp.]
MKFLVISGAPQTGKTTSINKIAEWLTIGITTDIYGEALPSFLPGIKGKYEDFSIVINRHGKKIIIHSATDNKPWMDKLTNKLKENPDTDVVVTSCRDIYWERNYFSDNVKPFASFFLESPLGKITRQKDFALANKLYKANLFLMHKHILINSPYNL